mmetsp:Transcript_12741/g.22531  ORF Transcript_12741/g.22531 Transcript_12741/m.22531 type:complete len:420 (-) Transcript_12741:347-1606(-)
MASKEEKPTLAGVTVRQRKRNIVIPVDPASFADAVIQIMQDAAEGGSLSDDLDAASKALDSAEIEYARYGDTLFEVLFAGGRMASGASLAEGGSRLATHILAAAGEREAIMPYIRVFQSLTRRRPFLLRGLENTLIKLLLSLEFFDAAGRRNIGIALALVFTQKIGIMPENLFTAMMNDRLVGKGTMLEMVTVFFQEFLSRDSLEDLVGVLAKGRVHHRLLDFFPPGKRTQADFAQHMQDAKLDVLVEWNAKRDVEAHTSELSDSLLTLFSTEPPTGMAEALTHVKTKQLENHLPDGDVLRVVWLALMRSVNMTGKNQQQVVQAIMAKIKAYHKLLSTFATSAKLELSLLQVVQAHCYEDNRLLKVFSDVVRLLYDSEIVGEDTIMHWYRKASLPKGRNVFLADIEPFIRWLDEAEEDD